MRKRPGTRPSRSRRSPGSRSSGSGSTVRSGWPRARGRPGRTRREEDTMRHVTLAMLATFAVLAAALGAPGAQSPQKVVFALNWFAVGDHPPAAPPGAAPRQLSPAFASLHGIYASKVTWVSIEPAAKFVTLAEKRVDVVADYLTGLPFYEKALGRENVASMPWHKHGFDTYSMSVIASEKTLNERPRVLRDFVAASYTGWRDVMGDPRAALEIFKRRVPEIDLALIEPNLRLGLELMKTDRYAKHGIGWMDRAKMCATVELINTYMPDMPRRVGCDEVFTNEFLTKIEPPRR